ncbi:polyprenyl synthetase family protein [Candidatus Poriferisocius sp.]|uniref:polyprenyl synthetase family protein n=1 Tax=Candidatus Poriferisocius sp. TaxID=3101276 RepID=UPI003B515E53
MIRSPLDPIPTMGRDLERLELRLEESIHTEPPFLTEVAGHLIRAGGKRVRPGFVIASASIAQTRPSPVEDDVLTGGVAVELVHLGSLYHDDVMDEAQVRRNVASVNAKWGNLRAILAGDFLLARASELAASLGTEVAGLLAATIGRLCEGQVRELQDTGNPDRTETSYTDSIEGKTASLLATSCRIGGLVAGLDRPTVDTLTEFGRYYGLAFQVVDDILDIVATDEHLGKPSGNDLHEGIYTLPVIRALGTSYGPQLRHLLGGTVSDATVRSALQLVQASGGVQEALDVARNYAQQASASLEVLPPTTATAALGVATAHLIDRARIPLGDA